MNHFLLLLTGHWLLATGTLETTSHLAFDEDKNNCHEQYEVTAEE